MINQRKRILLFIDWFSPGYKAGGPVTSCLNFIHLMKHDYDILVFTSDTDLGEPRPYSNIISNTWLPSEDGSFKIYYARKDSMSVQQISRITKEARPDFIYLNHIFSPWFVVCPLWLKWKGIIKCKMVVCPRGALYQSALAVKPYKKKPFLLLFRWMGIHKQVRFHATSEREKNAILHYFPGSETVLADDLPNTLQPAFQAVKKEPGILKCIFIARIHPIKNLLFLLSALQHVKAGLALTIIGPVEDQAYWEKCRAVISILPANINTHYAGALPNQALLPVLQEQHLFMLPTQGENFGHAIFESFLAGRPVLISNQTPWLQLESLKLGWDLPLDKPEAFVKAVETAAAWDEREFLAWARPAWQYARDFIDKRGLKQQYLHLFA